MSTLSWIILTIISLAFSALFSGFEIAYITADRVAVGLDVKKGLMGRIIGLYYKSQELFISTLLVGNNVVLVIYGMGAAALLEGWLKSINPNEGFVLAMSTLISTLVILFIGEFFPKTIFRINPNTSLKLFALPIMLFYIVLWPVSAFTSWLSRALMKLVGVHSASHSLGVLSIGDLNSYLERTIDDVNAPASETPVETEVKMFHNALDFSETQLRDCMVPRNEVVAVDIDETTRSELSDLFTQSGRSKIIVYKEDIDNVKGYIHVSELFTPDVDWTTQLKPVLFAPETMKANTMMRRLLQEKRSVAVVIDEFGGTSGIVTLEDLVEEIFGEFEDEHDRSDVVAREVEPGIYEFSGRIEVRTLRDEYRLDIPEEDDYQTLAGYILHNTGTIPEEGATIELDSLRFTIRQRTSTRLELIRVEAIPQPEE